MIDAGYPGDGRVQPKALLDEVKGGKVAVAPTTALTHFLRACVRACLRATWM